ncbi:ABC transporter permease [Peptoniphilus vaginalis]|uniref:ABC transporter permease n=1 Tax=Peptoniphilus vaginalis TaxID=1756987 RepID=UPI000A267184|nr:ABC transporter permease [Peptoniphilus vaginalis]
MSDVIIYYMENASYVFEQFIRHFLISIYGVLFASIVAIPLGFAVARKRKLSRLTISIANVMQTIPSLAMLAILMFLIGTGPNTVVFAVFLYAILPILKNTVGGISSVTPDLVDAAKGMGMTKYQIMIKVELPLAISIIMGGIRNALVLAIGVTAVGTFIGAGGLGDIITRGITVANGSPIIIGGAIPTALMAVLADFVLGAIENKLKPRTFTKI